MTIVGKILVFVNLIFSLVVGGFAVATYTTRFKYDAGYKDIEKQYKVAKANAEQYYTEAQTAKAAADARVKASEDKVAALQTEINGYKTQLTSESRKVNDAEARYAQAETASKAAQVEVSRRQADVEKIRETLNTELARNSNLAKDASDNRDRAVAAEIESKALKDRMARMEGQLQDTAKDLARIKANVGGGRGAGLSTANPPTDSVEGMVKTADATGLLKLSIGSDTGLARGHTLQLFRLAPQPKFLGTVRIVEVTPHEAVAQPIGRLLDKPREGDRVATDILGRN